MPLYIQQAKKKHTFYTHSYHTHARTNERTHQHLDLDVCPGSQLKQSAVVVSRVLVLEAGARDDRARRHCRRSATERRAITIQFHRRAEGCYERGSTSFGQNDETPQPTRVATKPDSCFTKFFRHTPT